MLHVFPSAINTKGYWEVTDVREDRKIYSGYAERFRQTFPAQVCGVFSYDILNERYWYFKGVGTPIFLTHAWIFSHNLTGIFLSTLDYRFITSWIICRSTPCFIGYTTIFLWILEKYVIFYVSFTRHLPGAACAPALQSFHYWLRNDVSISLSDVLFSPSASFTLEQL